MKQTVYIFIIYAFCLKSYGQTIQHIYQGKVTDSSFYHIEKISANEFWAGGEYGILKKIDSTGLITNISFPNEGQHILKIQKNKNFIYLITDNGVIFTYNIKNQSFNKKIFQEFKNKCFYDLIPLQNGKIMICGGSKGIAKAKKELPRGFIAITDSSLQDLEVVWKSYRKFVWSLIQQDDGQVLAATFNGFNTRIIHSSSFLKWKKKIKVKGLVHELKTIDQEVLYSGTESIRYKSNGLLGKIGHSSDIIEKTGCLWSMDGYLDEILAVTSNGLLTIDPQTLKINSKILQTNYALYDIQKIASHKYIAVGQNKNIYRIDFKP